MTETLRKTGVVAFISHHTINCNSKVAFAAVPKQDKDSYLYMQPVMELLKYMHCNCKEMSIAMVLLEFNTKNAVSKLAVLVKQQSSKFKYANKF